MTWLITNTIATLLLPPLSLLLLALAGLLLWRRRILSRVLVSAAVVLLWGLSLPVVSGGMGLWLERGAHTPVAQMSAAQAIVVLGGGSYFGAPEFGGDTVTDASLERVRLAARLQQQTGLPVLLTGGNPDGGSYPEAVLMQRVLEQEFHGKARWLESAANNTRDNAINSYAMLEPLGVRNIVLVTHAWHMPRARTAFERAGFTVLPAGTGFHVPGGKMTILSWLPSAAALHISSVYLHEAIGMVWYRLRAII